MIGEPRENDVELVVIGSSTTMLSMPPSRPSLGTTDKARITEELLSEAEAGRFTPAPYASPVRGSTRATPVGSPRSPQQLRRLTPIRNSTPRKPAQSKKEFKFGPGTKSHDGTEKGLKKCPSDPTQYSSGTPEKSTGQLNVAMLGLELEERDQQRVSNKRSMAMPVRKGHSRCHSEPYTVTPAPTDTKVEDFCLQGHSTSKASILTTSMELDDPSDPVSSNNKSSLRPPSSTVERPRMGSLDTIAESSAHSCRKTMLDLERMQLTNQTVTALQDTNLYPNSRKILPPTPINSTLNQPEEKDSSPRSDVDEELKDTADEEKIKIAVENPADLIKSKTVLKTGDFRIEDSRVRDSNDSGIPEDKGSSKSSSLNSSDSNISSSGEMANESQNKTAKKVIKPETAKKPVSRQGSTGISPSDNNNKTQPRIGNKGIGASSSEIAAKLKAIAKDNASRESDNSPKKVIVHSASEMINKTTLEAAKDSVNVMYAGIESGVTSGVSTPRTVKANAQKAANQQSTATDIKKKGTKTTVIMVQSAGQETSSPKTGVNNSATLRKQNSLESNSNTSSASSIHSNTVSASESVNSVDQKTANSSTGNRHAPNANRISSNTSRVSSNTGAAKNTASSRANSNTVSNTSRAPSSNVSNSRAPSNTVSNASRGTSSNVGRTPSNSRAPSNTGTNSRASSNTVSNRKVTSNISRTSSNTASNSRAPSNTVSNSRAPSNAAANTSRAPSNTASNTSRAPSNTVSNSRAPSNTAARGNTNSGINKPAQVTKMQSAGVCKINSGKELIKSSSVDNSGISDNKSSEKSQNSSTLSESKNQDCNESKDLVLDKEDKSCDDKNTITKDSSSDDTKKDSEENTGDKNNNKVLESNQENSNNDTTLDAGTKFAIQAVGNHPEGVDINNIVKVNFVEHTGPVIYDPFESLRREREKQEEEARAAEREKYAKSGRSRLGSMPMKKPREPQSRQASAVKKRKGSRMGAKSEDGAKTTRPKSSKKKGGKKKKKGDKEDVLEGKDITYISGIGWHIQADKSKTKSVKVEIENSDSDEDICQRLNYTEDPECSKNQTKDMSNLFPDSDDSDDDDEVDSDFEDIPAELVYDEVRYMFDDLPIPQSAHAKRTVPATKVYSALVDNPHEPEVTPQTVKAISVFENTLRPSDLEIMLGNERKYQPSLLSKSQDEESRTKRNQPKPSTSKSSVHPLVHSSSVDKDLPMTSHLSRGRSASVDTPTPRSSATQDGFPQRPPRPSKEKSSSGSDTSSPCGSAKLSQSAPQGSSVPIKPPRRKRSKTKVSPIPQTPKSQQDDDARINEIIEEILKSTPDPSMSLASKYSSSNSAKKDPSRKSVTREDLEKSLNRSQIFKEVRVTHDNSFDNKPEMDQIDQMLSMMVPEDGATGGREPMAGSPGQNEGRLREVLSQMNPDDLKQIHVLQKQVADLKEAEREQMNRLVTNIANLELKVHDSPKAETVLSKPPPGPSSRASNSRAAALEAKSPRFVQKHDTLPRQSLSLKNDDDDEDDDTFKSVTLHMTSGNNTGNVDNNSKVLDKSLPNSADNSVKYDSSNHPSMPGDVVTSRLGSCASRAGSSMTTASNASVVDPDVETIQWKRGNLLGKGAYGKVWCGLTNAGELIAVKQIELNIDDMERAEQEYEKIQEEVELLKTLNHKNIVGYRGTSLEDNIVSIFMQFVPGGSIANILARFGALEEEVFCHYTRQILEGVNYLHANNVIHRDIKGGNIMLMQNGTIKLIDFGCAKRLYVNMSIKKVANSSIGKNRLLKSMRGTPYWMAPEVVKEVGHGTKSDIWSIGCTVFEMATKKPPWAHMPPMSAIFCIGDDSKVIPVLPSKFSVEAIDFYNQCLQREPSIRPSAVELLSHPFVNKKKR